MDILSPFRGPEGIKFRVGTPGMDLAFQRKGRGNKQFAK